MVITEKQQKELFYYLNIYKNHLIENMTDDKIYNDVWQQDDINKLNKHIRLIKKIIKEKVIN
jgi:ribosome-binding ATPase YchF (GTP1/OBG family)